MPTSPVKTRIPLTSFGHLITEVKTASVKTETVVHLKRLAGPSVTIQSDKGLETLPEKHICSFRVLHAVLQHCASKKKQLFGIEAPASVELTGWKKHFNSYTLQGRRNCVLATYGILAVTAAAYLMHRQNKKENQASTSSA